MAAVPAGTLYGQPTTGTLLSPPGSRPAPAGGPYLGHTKCKANEETCMGNRALGTEYCIGHARQLGLVKFGKGDDVEPG